MLERPKTWRPEEKEEKAEEGEGEKEEEGLAGSGDLLLVAPVIIAEGGVGRSCHERIWTGDNVTNEGRCVGQLGVELAGGIGDMGARPLSAEDQRSGISFLSEW